jgi:hypothetical protein
MNNYGYQADLKEIYNKALGLYRKGNQDPSTYFDADEKAFLASIGARIQEVYDFVDDAERYGGPDYETFQLVMGVRRDFFLEVQKGVPSDSDIEESNLSAKRDAVRGILWLPRLIQKARARLKGALPDSLMFGCGGDRKFLKTHDIHPADFLRATWAFLDDDEKMIDWVESRSKVKTEIV